MAASWLVLLPGVGTAADLGPDSRLGASLDGLPQTRIDGVASDRPRSPLADILSTGVTRFDLWADAHGRCPADVVVWVPDGEKRFHAPLPHYVPGPEPGAFMCAADATAEGDHH